MLSEYLNQPYQEWHSDVVVLGCVFCCFGGYFWFCFTGIHAYVTSNEKKCHYIF